MTVSWYWWLLAEVLAAVTFISLILGGFAGYRIGCRDGLEERPRVRDLPPVELDMPALAPLNPDDPVDRLILEARMYEP